jgi:hypothetical protein
MHAHHVAPARLHEARMLLDALRECCVMVARAARRGDVAPRVSEADLVEIFGDQFLDRIAKVDPAAAMETGGIL